MASPHNTSYKDVLSNSTDNDLYRKVVQFWLIYRSIATPLYKALVVTIFGTGMLANAILLLYLFKSGKFRISVFALLSSLAVCDWVTCLGAVVAGVAMYPQISVPESWAFIANLNAYFTNTSYNASQCHLVFLAILRFYQLIYPLSARGRVTTSWVFKWCLTMWTTCAIISIPFAVYYIVCPINYHGERIIVYYFIGNNRLKEISIMVFCHILPTCIVALFHLLKHFKVTKNAGTKEVTQQERRGTSQKTVSAIIVLFILSILPRFAHGSYHEFLGFPYQSFHPVLFLCTALFGFSNSVFDPFLYLLSSKEIRQDLFRIICAYYEC